MQLPPDHILVQATKFILCGLVSASCYTATIVGLVELAGVHTALATAAGFSVGTVVSYVLNTTFTFQRALEGRSFVRFWMVTGMGLAINIAIVEGAQLIGLHYGFGVFASLIASPTFNFLAHRFWTYRAPASQLQADAAAEVVEQRQPPVVDATMGRRER